MSKNKFEKFMDINENDLLNDLLQTADKKYEKVIEKGDNIDKAYCNKIS